MNIKKTIADLFIKQTKKVPYRKIIGAIEDNRVNFLTYKELRDKVRFLSLGLESEGLKQGQRVAILSNTSIHWHIADMACLCSGLVSIPIYPTSSIDEIDYILEHCGARVIFIEGDFLFLKIKPLINKYNLKIISFASLSTNHPYRLLKDIEINGNEIYIGDTNQTRFEEVTKQIEPDSLATIIYTSGTTGYPKGVMLTHQNLFFVLNNIKRFLNKSVNSEDRSLVSLPLSHVLGRCDSYLYLVFGCQSVFSKGIESINHDIKIAKPTVFIGVPRIFEKMYESIISQLTTNHFISTTLFRWSMDVANRYYERIDNDLSPSLLDLSQYRIANETIFAKIRDKFGGKIRFFVSGGAPLSKEIIHFFRNINISLMEGYGLTETGGPITLNPVYKVIPGTVGLPIGDVQIRLAEDGEIEVKSGCVCSGYYKNNEETAEIFNNGWLKTGDIGILTQEGYLQIVDRKKDIIITSGGKNISPLKIEKIMKNQPHISQFMAIGDQKKFLTGIVGIEKSQFISDLEKLNLDHNASHFELSQNQEVYAIVKDEVEAANRQLSKHETIKKFIIAPMELSLENDFLTPSLKLKKQNILNKFKKDIDALYQSS